MDELISIDCPDMPMGVSRTFSVQRSALMRSPVLADFLTSPDYLPGCKMNLHFMNDPGVCFEVVQGYLENGPDCYPIRRLKIYITRLTKNADRFLVLIRLHKFSMKLGMVHLKTMAFEVIHDLEWEMSAEFCPKIAQLVFAHQSPYDSTIKLWVLKHIGNFHKKLSRSNTWAALVPILDPELGQQWATMNASGVRVLSMIEEEATDEAVSDVLAGLSTPAKNSAVSVIKGPSTSSSPSSSEASTQTDDSSFTVIPNKSEPSASDKPEVKKTDNATPKRKKHKRSKATMNKNQFNKNQFIISMHKEWVITCSPTKRSKMSPKSIKPTSLVAFKGQTKETNMDLHHSQPTVTFKPQTKETNMDLDQSQPTITLSHHEEDASAVAARNEASAINPTEQFNNEDLPNQQSHDDEWEDDEEEAAIQEAIRSFGTPPRDDSKALEVLGLCERRSGSIDGPPRPFDENAKARRVLGINDDGGGLIAGRKEANKMTRVKKGLAKFNDILKS